jgi:hypothetical protein
MNIRHALVLTVSIGLFLIGCTTPRDEARLERLMQHSSWPRIQQIAETEVKKREISWPEPVDYLPMEHKDTIWGVAAMTGTPSGDVQRVVMRHHADDRNTGSRQDDQRTRTRRCAAVSKRVRAPNAP